MKVLMLAAQNIYLTPASEDGKELTPCLEIVITTSEQRHVVDETGKNCIRRVVEDFRFHTTAKGLQKLSELFVEWADAAEELAELVSGATKRADGKAVTSP